MMSFDENKIKKSFTDSVIDTFAEMAFLDVIPENDFKDIIVHTSIMGLSFQSPGNGSIFFYMTKECKKKLVENIYGEDWIALSDLEIDDCLLEILNVVAGDFLKNLYGKEKKISMSFPKLFFDDGVLAMETSSLEFIFNAEGAMFSAKVRISA